MYLATEAVKQVGLLYDRKVSARLSAAENEGRLQVGTKDLKEQSSRRSPEARRPPTLRQGPAAADVGPRPHSV